MRVEGFIANNPQLCWVCGRSNTAMDLFLSRSPNNEGFLDALSELRDASPVSACRAPKVLCGRFL